MARTVPDWGEAAEDWLTTKRVGRRRDDAGHADRARRADLRRWAAAIDTVMGRQPANSPEVTDAWKSVMTELGDPDVLLRALDLLGDELENSTRQRMLSTLRGFCGYLTRRGLLAHDPTLADELKVTADPDDDVRAFTDDEIDRMLAAATDPSPARSAWPARDVAIIDVLAHCGLRVSELCEARDTTIDTSGGQPLLRLRHGTKRGRQRTVPLPHRTAQRLAAYRSERDHVVVNPPRLFVRRDGSPLNQQFIDAMLRRVTKAAGVTPPPGAMAHALRHSYGMRLAISGVPLSVIQQLMGHTDTKTTAIYTRAHATNLTDALETAGLL